MNKYITFYAVAEGHMRGRMDGGDKDELKLDTVLESFWDELQMNPGYKIEEYHGSMLLVSQLVKDKEFPVMGIAMLANENSDESDADALVEQYTL